MEDEKDVDGPEWPIISGKSLSLEADECTDPVDVGFFGANGIVEAAQGNADGFDEVMGVLSRRLGHEVPSKRGGVELRGGGKKMHKGGRQGTWLHGTAV
jgi:hypothetical protein